MMQYFLLSKIFPSIPVPILYGSIKQKNYRYPLNANVFNRNVYKILSKLKDQHMIFENVLKLQY